MENKDKIKIVMYTSIPRTFYTTLIAYLYEIAQVYPVVLLSEDLNPDIVTLLNNKKLFPKLEKIIKVNQYISNKRNPFFRNFYFNNLAKKIIKEHQTNVVITANDVYPFEMYLMRCAKKANAINICFQGALQAKDMKDLVEWFNMFSAYLEYPKILPLKIRILLSKIKKILGHIFYYLILPIFVLQKPFLEKSSFFLWTTNLSPQVTDFQTVFSEEDYKTYIKNGSSPDKVFILPHPLKLKSKEIFEKMNPEGLKSNHKNNNNNIITIMWPVEKVSFKMGNHSLITGKELLENRLEVIEIIRDILLEWDILIKPHPEMKNDKKQFNEIIDRIKSISNNIEIIDPEERAEKYIEMSDVIVGLPPASTTMFIASLQTPEKPILSLNLNRELMGDYYENTEGIDYISDKDNFIKTLTLIRDRKYRKDIKIDKEKSKRKFSSSVELIDMLLDKNIRQ